MIIYHYLRTFNYNFRATTTTTTTTTKNNNNNNNNNSINKK